MAFRPRGGRGRGGQKFSAQALANIQARQAAAAPGGGASLAPSDSFPAAAASNGVSSAPANSKVLISGLPPDVTESQVRDLMNATVAPPRRVTLAYHADGRSQGRAEVEFFLAGAGQKAFDLYNGKMVDDSFRLEVEIIGLPSPNLAAAQADGGAAPPLSLKQRLGLPGQPAPSPPIVAPVPVPARRAAPFPTRGTPSPALPFAPPGFRSSPGIPSRGSFRGGRGRGRGGRGGGPQRGPKTVGDLDKQMDLYMGKNAEAGAGAVKSEGADVKMQE